MCSCLSPLVGGTSVSGRVCSDGRTSEDGRYGPTARTLVGSEDKAEYVDTLDLGVQWTGAGAQAVSELSDFVRVGVHVLEVIGLAAGSAKGYPQ
jgi:hypothetical protein